MTDTEKDTEGLKGCIAILVALISYPFLWAWSGWVLMVLWWWFVVPLGAPEVSMAQGVGLAALVMLVRGHRKADGTEDLTEDLPGIIARGALIPAYILLVGWVAHWFMA